MKICRDCKQEKNFSDFTMHSNMADGYLPRCKQCHSLHRSKLYRSNKDLAEKKRAYNRERFQKNKENHLATIKAYLSTEEGKEAKRKAGLAWLARNKDKYEAYKKMSVALKYKRIEKGPCEKCGATEKVEAHHDDYSKPLEVRWLCPKHHKEHHRLEREAQRQAIQ